MFHPDNAHARSQQPSLLAMVGHVRDEQATAEDEGHEPRRRRIGMIAGLSVAGALIGAAAAMAWPQTYAATTEVMLSDALDNPSVTPRDADLALVETRLRLLRSGSVLSAAAERLNLAADPEFGGAANTASGDYARNIRRFLSPEPVGDDERRTQAVAALQDAIEVNRIGNSAVVAVTARSSDPEKSALLADAVSEAFLSLARAGGSANLDQLKADLDAAERALAGFRQESGLDITSADLARLDGQLAAARMRVTALDAQTAGGDSAGLDLMATGSIGGTSGLDEARARLASARQKVESLSERLGPRHPELIAAQAEMDGARREMNAESDRVAERLEAEKADAERVASDLAARLDGIRNAEAGEGISTLRALERTADTRRAALEHALQNGASGDSMQESWIVSRAERPVQAEGPSAPILSLAGAFGGLLAGLGFAGWRRAADDDAGRAANEHTDAYRDADFDDPYDAAIAAKEAEDMYPYQQHAYPTAPRHSQEHGDQQQPAPAHYAGVPSMPAHPQAVHAFHPAQMQDGWPMGYRGHPAQMMGYPHAQMPTVVYVPVPAQQMMPREDYHRAGHADRRTEAAIEEIRQSLRELREVIEDFADQRYG